MQSGIPDACKFRRSAEQNRRQSGEVVDGIATFVALALLGHLGTNTLYTHFKIGALAEK